MCEIVKIPTRKEKTAAQNSDTERVKRAFREPQSEQFTFTNDDGKEWPLLLFPDDWYASS